MTRLIAAALAGAAGLAAAVYIAGTGTTATNADLAAQNSGYMKQAETLSWHPVSGATGYALFRDGARVSTAGSGATSAKFVLPAGQHTIAAVALGTGTTTSTSTSTTLPATSTTTASSTTTSSSTTSTTSTVASTTTTSTIPTGQLVWLSPAGNDSTCVRNDRAHPCATFNRAFTVAQPGDSIAAHGGQYPADSPTANRNQLDAAKSAPVTFVCAGDGNVTFAAPNFMFWAGAANASIVGDCFHFHVVTAGLGGYPQLTHDIVLDGVHMENFEIIGARNVTIKNSEVGPLEACGAANAPAYAACDPGSYYAQFPNGTDEVQQEPFIHNGSAGRAQNVTLDNDRIHGITSKWSGTHTGGLLIWNTDGLRITNTTFDHNAIYDILENQGSSDTNVFFDSDTFAVPVCSNDAGDCVKYGGSGHALPAEFKELTLGGHGAALSGATISNSSFANGLSFSTAGSFSYSNVLVKGNQLGQSVCTVAAGITYSGNDRCG